MKGSVRKGRSCPSTRGTKNGGRLCDSLSEGVLDNVELLRTREGIQEKRGDKCEQKARGPENFAKRKNRQKLKGEGFCIVKKEGSGEAKSGTGGG